MDRQEDRESFWRAHVLEVFAQTYEIKCEKAVDCLTKDREFLVSLLKKFVLSDSM